MANTRVEKFTGKCRWAKVWPGQIDRDFEHEWKGGNWSIQVLLDPKDQLKVKVLSPRSKVRDEGYVTFRRFEKAPEWDQRPPKVEGVPEGTAIGNGSLVEVYMEVYPFEYKGQKREAMRLDSIRVLEHVPYERPAEGDTNNPPTNDLPVD